jgi:hypothetical protein
MPRFTRYDDATGEILATGATHSSLVSIGGPVIAEGSDPLTQKVSSESLVSKTEVAATVSPTSLAATNDVTVTAPAGVECYAFITDTNGAAVDFASIAPAASNAFTMNTAGSWRAVVAAAGYTTKVVDLTVT